MAADQRHELVSWYCPVLVTICPFYHVLEVLLLTLKVHFLCYSTEVSHWNEAGFWCIEQREKSIDVLGWVVLEQTRSEEMDEFLKWNVALTFRAQISDELVDAFCFCLASDASNRMLDFLMRREIPWGLTEPQWSRSNMSKIYLISRMSEEVRPDFW